MEPLDIADMNLVRFGRLPQGLIQATTTTSTRWDASSNIPGLQQLAQALGLKRAVWMAQEHGTTILEVGPDEAGEIGAGDALATMQRAVGLVVRHADCLPVLLYAPRVPAVMAIHAGWRGIIKGLPTVAVEWLHQRWGVDPGDVWAGIGPGLGPCCGEFRDWRELFPEWMERFRVGEKHFNLWEAARYQLIEAGLEPENIELAGICTCCDSRFHSYRRDKTTSRCFTIVGLI